MHEEDGVTIFVHEDELFGSGSGIVINPVDQISIRVYHRETFTTNQERFSPYCECRTRASGLYDGGDGHYWLRGGQHIIAVDRPWPMLREREHVQFFGVLGLLFWEWLDLVSSQHKYGKVRCIYREDLYIDKCVCGRRNIILLYLFHNIILSYL